MQATDIIPVKEALKLPAGSTVKVRGWAYRRRDLGDKAFIVVRDSTGIIQAVFTPDSPSHPDARKVTVESSLVVEGTLKDDPRAPGGKEIQGKKLEIVHLAENFPIRRDASR